MPGSGNFSMRVDPQELDFLRTAAQRARQSLSSYLMTAAMARARAELGEMTPEPAETAVVVPTTAPEPVKQPQLVQNQQKTRVDASPELVSTSLDENKVAALAKRYKTDYWAEPESEKQQWREFYEQERWYGRI